MSSFSQIISIVLISILSLAFSAPPNFNLISHTEFYYPSKIDSIKFQSGDIQLIHVDNSSWYSYNTKDSSTSSVTVCPQGNLVMNSQGKFFCILSSTSTNSTSISQVDPIQNKVLTSIVDTGVLLVNYFNDAIIMGPQITSKLTSWNIDIYDTTSNNYLCKSFSLKLDFTLPVSAVYPMASSIVVVQYDKAHDSWNFTWRSCKNNLNYLTTYKALGATQYVSSADFSNSNYFIAFVANQTAISVVSMAFSGQVVATKSFLSSVKYAFKFDNTRFVTFYQDDNKYQYLGVFNVSNNGQITQSGALCYSYKIPAVPEYIAGTMLVRLNFNSSSMTVDLNTLSILRADTGNPPVKLGNGSTLYYSAEGYWIQNKPNSPLTFISMPVSDYFEELGSPDFLWGIYHPEASNLTEYKSCYFLEIQKSKSSVKQYFFENCDSWGNPKFFALQDVRLGPNGVYNVTYKFGSNFYIVSTDNETDIRQISVYITNTAASYTFLDYKNNFIKILHSKNGRLVYDTFDLDNSAYVNTTTITPTTQLFSQGMQKVDKDLVIFANNAANSSHVIVYNMTSGSIFKQANIPLLVNSYSGNGFVPLGLSSTQKYYFSGVVVYDFLNRFWIYNSNGQGVQLPEQKDTVVYPAGSEMFAFVSRNNPAIGNITIYNVTSYTSEAPKEANQEKEFLAILI